jgi:hypothetical protein
MRARWFIDARQCNRPPALDDDVVGGAESQVANQREPERERLLVPMRSLAECDDGVRPKCVEDRRNGIDRNRRPRGGDCAPPMTVAALASMVLP